MVPARALVRLAAAAVLVAAAAAGFALGGPRLVDGLLEPSTGDDAPTSTPAADATPTAGATSSVATTPTNPGATPGPTTPGTPSPRPATVTPAEASLPGVSPWDGGSVVVAVDNTATPERDVTGLVAETIAYWEARDGRYAAYTADFVLRPDAEDPDLVVRFADEIGCESPSAVGCAPRLNGSTRLDPPVTVWIKAGFNDRRTRRVLDHEFGHVLGITHCEPPYAVMSHAHYCEPGTVPDAPAAAERPLPWLDSALAVHVDDGNVVAGDANATREQVAHAVGYFDGGVDGTLPANLSLAAVDRPWEADIAITFDDDPPCPGTGEAVCYRRGGPDFDNDGETEFYTNATIILGTDVDVAARGWYAAWALAHLLGLEDDELPPPLADASYEERRSEWWA